MNIFVLGFAFILNFIETVTAATINDKDIEFYNAVRMAYHDMSILI
jgi:hypothetical protein